MKQNLGGGNLKMFKRAVPLWVVILTLLMSTSAVFATIIATWQINTTMRVKRTVSIGVYGTDGITPLTAINLGDFVWNSGKMFPNAEQFYFVNNTDQTDFWISLVVEGLPIGAIVYLNVKRGDKSSFVELASGAIYEFPLISPINDPNPNVHFAYWYLRVWVNQPDFGTYTPILTFNAHDSATG